MLVRFDQDMSMYDASAAVMQLDGVPGNTWNFVGGTDYEIDGPGWDATTLPLPFAMTVPPIGPQTIAPQSGTCT